MKRRKSEPYWAPHYWLHLKWLQLRDHCDDHGIDLCEEWKEDYWAFFDWSVKNGYPKWDGKLKNKLKLERMDTGKGYGPGNCLWIVTESGKYYTRDT